VRRKPHPSSRNQSVRERTANEPASSSPSGRQRPRPDLAPFKESAHNREPACVVLPPLRQNGLAMPVRAIAQEFVDALSAAMPEGWSAEFQGSTFRLLGPDGPYASFDDWGLTEDVLLEDQLITAAEAALDVAQQWVAEETTEPWPAVTGTQYHGFPEPRAALVGDELRAWFGRRENPMLELGPFDVSGIVLRDD
jgi:hypothetical protein